MKTSHLVLLILFLLGVVGWSVLPRIVLWQSRKPDPMGLRNTTRGPSGLPLVLEAQCIKQIHQSVDKIPASDGGPVTFNDVDIEGEALVPGWGIIITEKGHLGTRQSGFQFDGNFALVKVVNRDWHQ